MSSAVMPHRPPEPEPVTHVRLFGVDNGVWRFTFLASYFALCAVSARSCPGIDFVQLLAMHLIWVCGASLFAKEVNGLVCDCLNEDQTAKHKLAVWKLEQQRPITAFRRDSPDGEWVDERLPLLDSRMGAQVRPPPKHVS